MERLEGFDTMQRVIPRKSSSQGLQMTRRSMCLNRARKQVVKCRYSSQYIDECANQEPPSLQVVLDSLTSTSSFVPGCEESVKDIHDIGSTLSSGYFSASSQSSQHTSEMTDCFGRFESFGYEGGLSRYLRRAQSSVSEGTSSAKEIGQSRGGQSTTSHPLYTSARSLKAYKALFSGLPTIRERRKSALRSVRFAERSPTHAPAHKRPRFTSVSSTVENLSQPCDASLDDTLNVSEAGGDEAVPSVSSPLQSRDSDFNIARQQSIVKAPPCPDVSPIQKRTLSRCISVPAKMAKDRRAKSSKFSFDSCKPDALPVVRRTDTGVSLVSVNTVAHLLTGKYAKKNVNYLIVDCRYPYEYNGGHIKEAVNIYTVSNLIREVFQRIPAQSPVNDTASFYLRDQLDRMMARENPTISLPAVSEYVRSSSSSSDDESEESFIGDVNAASIEFESDSAESEDEVSSPSLDVSGDSEPQPSYAVIFHCEFSSKRAPTMAKSLRKLDRSTNFARYPFLFFPDLYVMKGGYAEFYKRFPDLCEPSNYVKMFQKSFKSELRYCTRLVNQVSSCFDAAFRDPCLFARTSRSTNSGNKENETLQLRKVQTMFERKTASPLSEYFAKQKLASHDESITDINPDGAPSPKSKADSTEVPATLPQQTSDMPDEDYLRIVETVIRVGQHVIDAFERGWSRGRRSSSWSRASAFGVEPQRAPVRLSEGRPPIRPRLAPIPLSFSSSDSSGSNSPGPSETS